MNGFLAGSTLLIQRTARHQPTSNPSGRHADVAVSFYRQHVMAMRNFQITQTRDNRFHGRHMTHIGRGDGSKETPLAFTPRTEPERWPSIHAGDPAISMIRTSNRRWWRSSGTYGGAPIPRVKTCWRSLIKTGSAGSWNDPQPGELNG